MGNPTVLYKDGKILEEVQEEMDRARAKHGANSFDGDAMSDLQRVAGLMEEVDEVGRTFTYDQDHASELRKELIQVAASATAWASRL